MLAACGGADEGPEAAIRAWVERGEAAAESKDRNALMDMVSPAYADSRGNDRDAIGQRLWFYFQRQGSVALLTRIDELNVVGDSAAELVLQVAMAGTEAGAGGFDADAWTIEMELVRDDGEWLLIGARWAGLGEDAI